MWDLVVNKPDSPVEFLIEQLKAIAETPHSSTKKDEVDDTDNGVCILHFTLQYQYF